MREIHDIFQCIISGNADLLKQLLEGNRVDLSFTLRGATPLSSAIYLGRKKCFEVLLEFDAPVDCKSRDSCHRIETPLISAIRLGYDDLVDELLLRGARLDLENFYGQTALWFAVKERRVKIVTKLLANGASIFFRTGEQSPLNYVVQYFGYEGRRRMALELVEAGLDVDLKSYNGTRPSSWIVKCSDFSFFKLLYEAGAKVSQIPSSKLAFLYPESWISNPLYNSWLSRVHCSPLPLTMLCRKEIRELLRKLHKKDLRDLVKLLPLPKRIRNFILLEDAIKFAMQHSPFVQK